MSASTSARWPHAQAAAARGHELGLVVVDRPRDDQLHVAVQVRRVVADARVDALRAQLLDGRRRAIAARDRAAVAPQHARDARHAGAADAQEVQLGAHGRPRARRRSSRATAAAASGRAQARMPLRISVEPPGLGAQIGDARAQGLAVERGVLDDHRSAGGGEVPRHSRADGRPWHGDRVRAGRAGRPPRAPRRVPPARLTARSAAARTVQKRSVVASTR